MTPDATRTSVCRSLPTCVGGPQHIAEGAGGWSRAVGAKHYKIASGEAMECAASLDVLKLRALITPSRYPMLTKRV